LETLIEIFQSGLENNFDGFKNKNICFIKKEKEEVYVSYEQLYQKASYILGYLQTKGIKPGEELVILQEDNEHFIYLFWACILGGIIPVPISMSGNNEHKWKVVNIWRVLHKPHLVTSEELFNTFEEFASKRMEISAIAQNIKSNTILISGINLSKPGIIHAAKPSDIALIQFSSGSTGEPKGVILTHKNLTTNIKAIIKSTRGTYNDMTLSWLPLTHDMGLIAFHLTPFVLGINQINLLTPLFIRRPLLWMDKASQHKATILCSPNFGYKYFLSFLKLDMVMNWDLLQVRFIFNGAEPISSKLCREFVAEMSKYGLRPNAILSGYGLAEASVAVTFPPLEENIVSYKLNRKHLSVGDHVEELDEKDSSGVSFVDVGFPVDNCEVRICDSNSNVLEEDKIGCIQIKGDNVTTGYYNNQTASEQVILKDGWLNTGDLGFMRNGRLIVTGRLKDVIIVNGQNYYSHDIERVAEETEEVELGQVVACGVCNNETHEEDVVLFVLYKKEVGRFLPIVMILKKYIYKHLGLAIKDVVPVKKIPKTTSGKVMRFKLKEMYLNGEFLDEVQELNQLAAKHEETNKVILKGRDNAIYTETEKNIAQIWGDTLGCEELNIFDNFFELGGNSISAISMCNKIECLTGKKFTIAEALKYLTVSDIAQYLEKTDLNKNENIYATLRPMPQQKFYPLSAAQKRLFSLNQIFPDDVSYNIADFFIIKAGFNKEKFENAIKELISRHEILRTSLKTVDNEIVQVIHDNMELKIDYHDISEKEDQNLYIQNMINEFVRPFNLEITPLFRIAVVQLNEKDHMIFFDKHHIIWDGFSTSIFLKEFFHLYRDNTLSEIRLQYKDYAVWQKELRDKTLLKKQEEFWVNQFADKIPVLSLPSDFPRPEIRTTKANKVHFMADDVFVKALKGIALENKTTIYIVLLTCFYILLEKYSNQEDIIIGSVISGRGHQDLDNTIGMFVNTLAVRNYPKGDKHFRDFLKEVKENVISAFENQDFQFEELIAKLALKRDLSRNPLFDVMFILQNIKMPELQDLVVCEFNIEASQYDLVLEAVESGDAIIFNFKYSTDLFKRETIDRITKDYLKVLENIIDNQNISIKQIELITDFIKDERVITEDIDCF
jgi:acyl-CoA synthetase (AMP-forming)/AMP-acid ligase II/acyl carrier protein